MTRSLSMALGCALLAFMTLSACGPQPPNTQGTKPNPVYEVPKEQLAAEASGNETQYAKRKVGQAQAASVPAGVALNRKETVGGAKEFSSEKKYSVSGGTAFKTDTKAVLGKDAPEGVKTEEKPPATAPATPPATAAQPQTQASKADDSKRGVFTGTADTGTVSSVISYGTGETSLKVKKNVENKLKNINSNHNSDLDKALKEQ